MVDFKKMLETSSFGYKDHHYRLADLLDFVAKTKIRTVQFTDIEKVLRFLTIDNVWGSIDTKDRSVRYEVTLWELLGHIARINTCDYKTYPIIVVQLPQAFKILDGHHRLVKAALDRKSHIPALVLSESQMVEFTNSYSGILDK